MNPNSNANQERKTNGNLEKTIRNKRMINMQTEKERLIGTAKKDTLEKNIKTEFSKNLI